MVEKRVEPGDGGIDVLLRRGVGGSNMMIIGAAGLFSWCSARRSRCYGRRTTIAEDVRRREKLAEDAFPRDLDVFAADAR
ncbi:MAG: hypothetical protein OTJ97_10360, partial [SAR202 cluster bacterium]|nr:hypothetical protein [SAR202 cluster bacterium]